MPPDTVPKGRVIHDVVSQDTAPEDRAPYGDSYKLNLFERPFSQDMATYFPNVDISSFALAQDENWFFFSISMVGPIRFAGVQVYYGVELDLKNMDGFGDYLIWALPTSSKVWTTQNLQVLADKNHDSAGLSAEESDAPFTGDGYETVVFNGYSNSNADPGLAWFRIDPASAATIQFAVERSLIGTSFMWGAWADGGLRDPGMFSYNDRFTEEQAGSPVRNKAYYPINAVYLVDSTCRMPYGFTLTGFEPLLCPPNEPVSTTHPRSPQQPTPTMGANSTALPPGTP